MPNDTAARIHRFRDAVALSMPGDGPTIYLTAREARALAGALTRYAIDVKDLDYSDSQLRGETVQLAAPIRS